MKTFIVTTGEYEWLEMFKVLANSEEEAIETLKKLRPKSNFTGIISSCIELNDEIVQDL